jgi:beta-barrel assembly-enhancing protease
MKKILTQFAILIAVIGLAWFALSRINYTESLDIEKFNNETEEKIGDLIFDYIKTTNEEIDSDTAIIILNKIRDRICKSNNIDHDEIKIHLLDNSQINAFALPDRHMIINSGLIEYCDNPEELASVMAHEIAHMQNKHLMKRMSREFGIAMLVSMVGGDASSEVLREIVRSITSKAFDRTEESEADEYAVSYLANANIDPEHFANFLYRLSLDEPSYLEKLQWVNSHPNTQDRTTEILRLRKLEDIEIEELLDKGQWHSLQRSTE